MTVRELRAILFEIEEQDKEIKLEDLEKILEKVCSQYETDCNKCPCQKECEEYSKLYQC